MPFYYTYVVMPIIRSAKKKARQDIKRTKINQAVRSSYKSAVKDAREKTSTESLTLAFRQLDMAAKKRIIHPNKASRLKSNLSKHVASAAKGSKQAVKPVKKKAAKKKSAAKKKTA